MPEEKRTRGTDLFYLLNVAWAPFECIGIVFYTSPKIKDSCRRVHALRYRVPLIARARIFFTFPQLVFVTINSRGSLEIKM